MSEEYDEEVKRRNPSVCFDKMPIVHEIPHIGNLSLDEKSDVWFTGSDFKRMKKSDRCLLRTIRNGAPVPSEARGLEARRSPIAFMESRISIMDGIAAVLSEQSRQKSLGEKDSEVIREKYQNATANFASQALLRGANDAEEARGEALDETVVAANNKTASDSSSSETVTEMLPADMLQKRKFNGIFNTRKVFQLFLTRARPPTRRIESDEHHQRTSVY